MKVEVLAKRLGVTKGSFYWHFVDREALIGLALEAWSIGRIRAIRDQTNSGDDAITVLKRLVDLYLRAPNPRGLALELAIRALAKRDAPANSIVEIVDKERLAHVTVLFEELGHADARARALLFYAFLFGQSLLRGKDLADARQAAARLVTS